MYSLPEIVEKVKPFAEKYAIEEMYLFGSYARNEADEYSDLDFVVQEKGTNIEGGDFFVFQMELEDAFQVNVDLLTLESAYASPTRFENRFTPRFEREKVRII